jgi:maleylacetoacetate isomerase
MSSLSNGPIGIFYAALYLLSVVGGLPRSDRPCAQGHRLRAGAREPGTGWRRPALASLPSHQSAGRVPSLVLDDGTVLIQSPAILEYLEDVFPDPPLLPRSAVERARVRGVAALIGCDIHPLNNSSPLNYLRQQLGQSEAAASAWICNWIHAGFQAVERLIGENDFCFGSTPSLADVYLVPQVFSARRFSVPLEAYPRILRVEALAATHPAFAAAHPSRQTDATQSGHGSRGYDGSPPIPGREEPSSP